MEKSTVEIVDRLYEVVSKCREHLELHYFTTPPQLSAKAKKGVGLLLVYPLKGVSMDDYFIEELRGMIDWVENLSVMRQGEFFLKEFVFQPLIDTRRIDDFSFQKLLHAVSKKEFEFVLVSNFLYERFPDRLWISLCEVCSSSGVELYAVDLWSNLNDKDVKGLVSFNYAIKKFMGKVKRVRAERIKRVKMRMGVHGMPNDIFSV